MRVLYHLIAVSLVALHFPNVAAAQTGVTEPPRPAGAPPAAPAPSAPTDKAPPTTEPPPVTLPPSSTAAATAEQRIEELERRLRQLEEKHAAPHDIADAKLGDKASAGDAKATDKPAAKPPSGVAIGYGPEGVGIASADGKFSFRFRPIIQADARFFLNEGTNTFLMRRVRPAIEGTVFEYFEWRLMPELSGAANVQAPGTPNLQDAFVNVRLWREIQLRAGKFKPPVGFERLMSAPDLPFLERGLPTNLVPDRDVGVQLHGDVLGGTIVYAAGVFNGSPDGFNGDVDNNDKKDLAGRIVIRPFQPMFIEPLRMLGFGIAATRGTHVGALPPYRTPVGTPFFQFNDGVAAGGTHRRLAPQAYFYLGPFGIFGEYTRSTQIVMAPGLSTRLHHTSWQVVGSFFVTGEDASFLTVTPKRALNPRNFGTGAIEIVARYGELSIDQDAFTLRVADTTRSSHKAVNWAVGVNWHLARNFKWMMNYERTSFEGGAAVGDRPAETLILSRLQAAY